MTEPLNSPQLDLKYQVNQAFSSVFLSESARKDLRAKILGQPLDDSFGATKKVALPKRYGWDVIRKIHNSGLGYLAAGMLFSFVYFGTSENDVVTSSADMSSGKWEGNSIQDNKLNGLFPADFDLEGDYDALPAMVRNVIGDEFTKGVVYELKAPSKVRGHFSPGEGRFFATNKENVGVSLRLKPQREQWGTKAKTLFVVPADVTGAEVKQVMRQQESSSSRIKDRVQKFVRWNKALSEPREKSIEELIDESNQEMGETIDSRTGNASWKSGQFRYVLFND